MAPSVRGLPRSGWRSAVKPASLSGSGHGAEEIRFFYSFRHGCAVTPPSMREAIMAPSDRCPVLSFFLCLVSESPFYRIFFVL